jgi:hypothetical protein
MADTVGAGKVNLAALGVGAGGLATVLGGLSLTGITGRVMRNDPEAIAVGLVLVLIGATLLGAAGLPATGKPVEVIFSLIGLELTMAGLIVVGVTAVGTAGQGERPLISVKLEDNGRRVTGKVTAGNLDSSARFTVIVDGITKTSDHKPMPITLSRADIGPDGEGKVDLPIDMRVPAGRFDEVRVAGWSVDPHAGESDEEPPRNTPCDEGATRPQYGDKPALSGTGCVSLPLPPVAVAPNVEAHWIGSKTESQRVEVRVTADNAAAALSVADGKDTRVAVVVKRRRAKGHLRFYRAMFTPDGNGKVDVKFQLPVVPGAKRVCVGAAFVERGSFPSFRCKGTVEDFKQNGQAVVQLRQPKAAAEPEAKTS